MWRSKEGRMDLRRSPWILGEVLACFATVCTRAGADEPNFTEEQKIDFLQHAKVIASKPEKKGKSHALHLTLTFVDFERSLYKGIHTLRGSLGDSAIAPRYIETVTGRGYRFIPIPQEPSNHRGRRRNGCKVGSVAVLPFASESADAEMELLNRRIIERVIDTISRAPGVRVLAYNTVQHHRGRDLDSRRLGENLLVDAIAVGGIIRQHHELLWPVELDDVSNGSQLWGEQFKEHYSDVLEEPETLADKICDRLRPILAPTANSRRNERSRHTQRNQAGGAFRVYDGTNNKVTASSQSGLESGASVFRAKRQ